MCYRWREISKVSWHGFTKLIYQNDCWGFNEPDLVDKIDIYILAMVLIRCGRFLTEIDFSYSTTEHSDLLCLVAFFCPNIQSIYVQRTDVSPRSIQLLAEKCHKITSLTLGGCTNSCDTELSVLFENNQRIKKLSINFNDHFSGECLSKLNSECIESLYFDQCYNLSLNHLKVS